MKEQRLRRLCYLLWIAFGVVSAADREPLAPPEVFSPDREYSVRLDRSELPTTDSVNDSTLVITHKGHVLSHFPTFGSLSEVFWSPAGYLAINNRRANNGDYLWVCRLHDGKALKVPDDNNVFVATAQCVSTKFPDLLPSKLLRGYMTALGWKNTNELRVKTGLIYQNLDNATIEVVEVYRVEEGGLNRVDQDIQKVPLPSLR
jgi:hypothetical protein